MRQKFKDGSISVNEYVLESDDFDADLFFKELIGGTANIGPPRARSAVGERMSYEAELFFSELTGSIPRTRWQAGYETSEEPEPLPPGFLRWSPGYRGHFPPRPSGAKGGRISMQASSIAGRERPQNWAGREDALVRQLVAGNMPDALLHWVDIELPPITRGGRMLRGTVKVLPDYLSIGSDSDFIHAPLDPVSAQKVAYELDAMLPTARVCHAIYLATPAAQRVGIIPRDYYQPDAQRRTAPRGQTQDSTAAYIEHSEAIQRKMRERGIRLGTLVAGHKKDVVISRALHLNPNRIAFHGFYDASGYPMEPCYENSAHRPKPSCRRDAPTLAHSRRFSDYSQGVRLMSKQMIFNGEPRSVADVLSDPDSSWLLSSEGTIVPPRIPSSAGRRRARSQGEVESIVALQRVPLHAPHQPAEEQAYPIHSEQPTPATPTPATPAPYLPTGGRNFVPQAGTFNCSPTPYTVIPASFLPSPTGTPDAAVDAALTAAGLNAAQRRRVSRAGLIPIAREFGERALVELFARLRWSAADIAQNGWGRGSNSMLVQRLLIHIPGHFRELARRAPNAGEAFMLECLGWLLMSTLRDSVAAVTRQRWWIPPAPDFVTAVPSPVPAASTEVQRMFTRHLYIDTLMTAGHWNARFNSWVTGLAGRQWQAEVFAVPPGLPFYASLVTVPAHVNTTAVRASFVTAWSNRLVDTDAAHPPHAATATRVTLAGLLNAISLRQCNNSNRHLPSGTLSSISLQGLELAYDFPVQVGRRTIRQLPLLQQLHPVYTALFRAIKELGWNDLLYQTSGAGCFRGIKHPAAARVNIGGTMMLVDPFNRPDATTVTRININFNAAQRARVIRATRTARRMSEHGLGAAIDINYPENTQNNASRPFGSMDPRITAIFEAFNFRWGGCFSTTDPHHFEYCRTACAPAPVPATLRPGAPATRGGGAIPSGVGPMIA